VRIDPDQTDFLAALAKDLGHARYCPGRHRVIAAQHQRDLAGLHNILHDAGEFRAAFGNLREILGVLRTGWSALRLGDGDISQILHLVTERFELRVQPRQAKSGRAHIDASASGAQVEGRA
jgi:hypothetical protein